MAEAAGSTSNRLAPPRVSEQRGIGSPVTRGEPLPLDEAAEAWRRAAFRHQPAPSPLLADLTNRVQLDGLWRRPVLALRDRSLATIAARIAKGQAEQISFHANRAMDAGLTGTELSEAVTRFAFDASWPRSMSAVPIVPKILAERSGAASPRGSRLFVSSATQSRRPRQDQQATSLAPRTPRLASRPRAPRGWAERSSLLSRDHEWPGTRTLWVRP